MVDLMKETVSIEKVLNSRCSFSFDNGNITSHWGHFTNQLPSQNIINSILDCCDNIPRFSNGKLVHWFKDGRLILGFEKLNNPDIEHKLHIESGMQQQAIYLACTTHGVGTCIFNQGVNGTEYNGKVATASFSILEGLDPYGSGKFSINPPGPEKPFKTSKTLREPSRDGDVKCLPELEKLSACNSGLSANNDEISQLLWAAKGRTPHYIRKHAWKKLWGLTIPTWSGVQNFTSVYLLQDDKLYNYINWTKDFSVINRGLRTYLKWTRGNPTHDIRFVKKVKKFKTLDETNRAIILCRNEITNRGLWEIGYMLENMFLQTKSFNISYDCKLFSNQEQLQLEESGLTNAVAAITL